MAWPEGGVIPAGWFEWPVEATNWHVDTSEYVSPGSSLSASSTGRDGALIYSAEYDTTAIASPRLTVSTRISSVNSSAFINVYRCGIPYPGDQPPVVETLAEHTVADSTGWLSHTVDIPPGTGYIMFYVTGIGDSATGWIDDFALGEIEAGPTESLPLRLTIEASPQIALPLRLQIGSASGIAPLPLRLSVIDEAIFSGFDGTVGWAPAPSGQWRPLVTLDGVELTQLVGDITVTSTRNEARTAEFSFLPASVIAPMALIGRRVQIAFAERDASGTAVNPQLLFTGVIETPEVDVQTGVVSCTCHDQTQEIVANTPTEWLDAEIGGRYRVEIDREPADNWEYALSRLRSVPASIALDERQQVRILPWFGSGLISTRVTEGDYLDGSLSVTLPSRSDLITRVTCRIQYKYERLRGRGISASWSKGILFFTGSTRGTLLEKPHTWLTTDMTQAAIEGLDGWTLDSMQLTHPRPDSYMLGDTSSEGYYIIRDDVAPSLVIGFNARWNTRWQQTVIEDYTITVVADSLEAQIGEPIESETGVTLESSFDADNWENDPTLEPALTVPASGDAITPWEADGAGTADRDDLISTVLDRAWVDIADASRTGRASFDLPLRPDVWLDRRFEVDAQRLHAEGTAYSITHTMSPDGGTAKTAVTLAIGMPGNVPAALPTWALPAAVYPDETRPLSSYSVPVPTWVGGESTSPVYDEETMYGFITNEDYGAQPAGYNWYSVALDLRSPEIDATDRDPITVETASTVSVSIPTDLLELL